MIENCGQCMHVFSKSAMGLAIYGCKHPKWKAKLRPIVPHTSHREFATGTRTATFHRVPEWCPRPDSEVHKQPEPDADEGELAAESEREHDRQKE